MHGTRARVDRARVACRCRGVADRPADRAALHKPREGQSEEKLLAAARRAAISASLAAHPVCSKALPYVLPQKAQAQPLAPAQDGPRRPSKRPAPGASYPAGRCSRELGVDRQVSNEGGVSDGCDDVEDDGDDGGPEAGGCDESPEADGSPTAPGASMSGFGMGYGMGMPWMIPNYGMVGGMPNGLPQEGPHTNTTDFHCKVKRLVGWLQKCPLSGSHSPSDVHVWATALSSLSPPLPIVPVHNCCPYPYAMHPGMMGPPGMQGWGGGPVMPPAAIGFSGMRGMPGAMMGGNKHTRKPMKSQKAKRRRGTRSPPAPLPAPGPAHSLTVDESNDERSPAQACAPPAHALSPRSVHERSREERTEEPVREDTDTVEHRREHERGRKHGRSPGQTVRPACRLSKEPGPRGNAVARTTSAVGAAAPAAEAVAGGCVVASRELPRLAPVRTTVSPPGRNLPCCAAPQQQRATPAADLSPTSCTQDAPSSPSKTVSPAKSSKSATPRSKASSSRKLSTRHLAATGLPTGGTEADGEGAQAMGAAASSANEGDAAARQILTGRHAGMEVTKATLQRLYLLPIKDAADSLGMGVTLLKRLCRCYNVHRWPQRKLASLDKLIQQFERLGGEESKLHLERLKLQRDLIFEDPNADLDDFAKKLRQASLKAQHTARVVKPTTDLELRQEEGGHAGNGSETTADLADDVNPSSIEEIEAALGGSLPAGPSKRQRTGPGPGAAGPSDRLAQGTGADAARDAEGRATDQTAGQGTDRSGERASPRTAHGPAAQRVHAAFVQGAGHAPAAPCSPGVHPSSNLELGESGGTPSGDLCKFPGVASRNTDTISATAEGMDNVSG